MSPMYSELRWKDCVYTHRCLLLKEFPLPNGVIQLCVGIADLLFHDKELEALS